MSGDYGAETDDEDNEYLADDRHADHEVRYGRFDAQTMSIMTANSVCLSTSRAENATVPTDTPPETFRFDVISAEDLSHDNSVCTIDLKKLAHHAVKQRTGMDTLPSNFCYIKELSIESIRNTLPLDVHILCHQGQRVLGSYVRGCMDGKDNAHNSTPSTYVAHQNTTWYHQGGPVVYSRAATGQDHLLCSYRDALDTDIDKCTSYLEAQQCYEYVSPCALVPDDSDAKATKGDWLIDLLFSNGKTIKRKVTAIANERVEEDGSVRNFASIRVHKSDWEPFRRRVHEMVVHPLRTSIINLDQDGIMRVSMEPHGDYRGEGGGDDDDEAPGILPTTNKKDTWYKMKNKELWKKYAKGVEGGCTTVMQCSLQFV